MTDLENKVLDRILEKINIEELIEKIGYEKLTDKIAEKAAELIVQKEYPNKPIIQPINPSPWRTEPYPITPVTVMYGCTPSEYTIDGMNELKDLSTYKQDNNAK